RGLRRRGRAPARRPPHVLQRRQPHLPRRVRPPEEGGRLRRVRRQAHRPRRRQARGDPEPACYLPFQDGAADRLLRPPGHPPPRRRHPGSRQGRVRDSWSDRDAPEGERAVILTKTPDQVDEMAAAGAIQARCLKLLADKAQEGMTTADLDEAAARFIASQDAEAAFKGYRGFPGSICASPNSMVVHGIPGPYTLKRGDIISLDVGVVYQGWVADAAMTLPIGSISDDARALLDTTRAALFAGADQARPGNHLGDVSAAVQARVEEDGLSIIRTLVGHGIGRDMHEDPQIPNYGEPGRGPELQPGMA